MAAVAIQAENLDKWFGEGEARTYAVRQVNFTVPFGQMFYIVGPSGSGKTTLLSMISGILRPNGGRVVVAGEDIWRLSPDALATFRLHTLGFVFQDYHLFPRLTTLENVAIPLILQRWEWSKAMAAAQEMLAVVGLQDRGELRPMQLSGGEQQRVAIARALVAKPTIIVFDEPTASLDGATGKMIIGFVKHDILNDHRCILIVTHDNRIFPYADQMLHMEDGAVVKLDTGGSLEK